MCIRDSYSAFELELGEFLTAIAPYGIIGFLASIAPCMLTVSYTHLDVYKRQEEARDVRPVLVQISLEALGENRAGDVAAAAVEQLDLALPRITDVYKRQGLQAEKGCESEE